MGWEFAAVWLDDTRPAWHWIWRRIADDTGKLLEQSPPFGALARGVEDARAHGFDEDGCGPLT
jgi:hypothetical protein